jgi:hypothetical protein
MSENTEKKKNGTRETQQSSSACMNDGMGSGLLYMKACPAALHPNVYNA